MQSCDSSNSRRTDLQIPQTDSIITDPSQASIPTTISQSRGNRRLHDEPSFRFQSNHRNTDSGHQKDSYILGLYDVTANHQTSPEGPRQPGPILLSDQIPYDNQFKPDPRPQRLRSNHIRCPKESKIPLGRKGQALGFGSDAGFRSQCYAPPPSLEDSQVIEGRVLKVLEGLEEAQTSATNTQPSSPIISKLKRHCSNTNPNAARQMSGLYTEDVDSNQGGKSASEKRRRKSKNHDHEEWAENPHGVNMQSRRSKKMKPDIKIRLSSDEGRLNRRRSYPADHRPQRQNLTEEEKKQNHIKSEQKRRNQIKEGFDALIELIPDGMSAATSKCAILAKAAEWLSGLIDGNERLRGELAAIDGRII